MAALDRSTNHWVTDAQGPSDGTTGSDEDAKARNQVRSRQKDRHVEVVKDSIARDIGSFFQVGV